MPRVLPAGTVRALGPVLLVLGAAVATYSVVRYELRIVAVYTALTVALAVAVARASARPCGTPGGTTRLPGTALSPLASRGIAALVLVLTGIAVVRVHAYSYLEPGDARAVRWGLATAAVLAAGLVLLPDRSLPHRWVPARLRRPGVGLHDAALGVAALAYLASAVALIRLDPRPRIDVWVTLQQASDALWRGDNFYAVNWTGSPGVQDAFTYLPWMAVLLSPGRLLAGDVRWALVVVTLLGALAIRATAWARTTGTAAVGPGSPDASRAAAVAATLLLLLPGTPTQVEQAWTEPLLFACLAGWMLAVLRGRGLLAVACLALGIASKQHLVLLLPVLAAWRPFGWRRAAGSAALGGLLVLPWFLTSPADMWHDTVRLLVDFPPLRFADTLYIAAMRELDWTPPFWLTGAIVLGTCGAAVVAVARRAPGPAGVLRWCALVLLVASLVNKQAFYNQYWLVLALVLAAWAVPEPTTQPRATDQVLRSVRARHGTGDGDPVAPPTGEPRTPAAEPAAEGRG
ncbi:MAG: hypothetical protein GXX79_03805 [Actinomycetales bacterium]|nr:hypothetical protein [Actinomycetales bacterium]